MWSSHLGRCRSRRSSERLHFYQVTLFSVKQCVSRRLCYSFSREQRHLASPCFSLTIMFNRSEELEIHGPSTNRLKSWCISMKLVSQVQWPTTWFTPSWTRTQTFWDVQEDSQSGRQPWRQLESNKNRRRSRIATSQSSKSNRESHYRLTRAKTRGGEASNEQALLTG